VRHPPRQSRAQGRPGARCTHGPRAKRCLRVRALTTGTGGITPAFPAQWFTAYFALSPVNQLVATVIFEKAQASSKTWRLHGRARTTRLGRPQSAPLVSRPLRVHRIPPRVRDDASAPLAGTGRPNHTSDSYFCKTEFFCNGSLTGFLQHDPTGKSVCNFEQRFDAADHQDPNR
jgi:hypothetical protein